MTLGTAEIRMAAVMTLGTAEIRAIAVGADADPRTVRRVLSGERVRGMVDARIRRALAARGIVPPVSEAALEIATEQPLHAETR